MTNDGAETSLVFGPTILSNGLVGFNLWAPSLDALQVRVDDGAPQAMQKGGAGWFHAEVPATAGARYAFVLPDGTQVPDPASQAQHDSVHGPSLVVDHAAYEWQATGWVNRPWHEAAIYEVHPGAFGGFAGIRSQLPRLAELGVTAIELMPIADFPGRHNWGYDGVLPYAPASAYGTPDELKALIDDAHTLGLMVFLDVVYNHFGPDGAYLHSYAAIFFDEGVHTPWGAAIDFKKPEVKAFYIQNALLWLNVYRFDGLRFDAVHAISPPGFLPELAQAIRAGADRPVHLILEHEGNKSSLLTGPAAGLFDAQWADDWHHCLHVLLTGEQEGYYESFADPAAQLATAMAEGFVYQGQISPHHGEPRGEPSADLASTAFVICLQNHDQIGNRAMGERLAALAAPQALAAATALLLLSPNIPLLFMGEEWGTRTPFLFFTDHNDELAELIRQGRRREFAHFAAFKDETRRAQIPDPNAAATFEASRPDLAEIGQPAHARVYDLHKTLLALRAARIVPGLVGCRSEGAHAIGSAAVHGKWRLGNGALLTIAANFADAPVAAPDMPDPVIFATVARPPGGPLPAHCTIATLTEAA